ncbi:hypothetical protein PV04_05771 [Phialophora macrospora]|uniref:DUF7923 domain-containing protein n=1 Tax=Phialophora macrospora TaxID=1851006 RepID=A0A0D2CMI6_9EURO|nr:hypothetical protein PV04_05771 [Phialophora macrospora]
MSLSSWISAFRSKAIPLESTEANGTGSASEDGQTPVEHIDFATLADRVEELRYELDRARDMCEQANVEFDRYRIEIHRLKCTLDAERDASAKAHKLLMREIDRTKELQNREKNLQISLRRETLSNSQLQARLNTETASLKAMTKHARTQEEKLIDTQLELEYLKCTTSVEPPLDPTVALDQHAPLPAQPFVVVLVDGDAYQWAPDISNNNCPPGAVSACNNFDGSGPGAMAATRIRNEVTKYILSQQGTIPVTAKIVTRVFCNFSSRPPGLMTNFRKSGPAVLSLGEFAVQFTEKLPLFDFFDAGRGKERADDKIRENFHLFLSTPNCHALFVAACLDNGFARMLEQYSDHPLARRKIVLVSPGYVALEIQRLCLEEIEWPNVFAKRVPPPDVAVKYAREKVKVQNQRARAQRSVSMPVVGGGIPTSNVHPKLLDMVPAWNVNAAMMRASSGVGFRVALNRAALESRDVMETIEPPDEID